MGAIRNWAPVPGVQPITAACIQAEGVHDDFRKMAEVVYNRLEAPTPRYATGLHSQIRHDQPE